MPTLAHSAVTLSAWESFYVIVSSSAGALYCANVARWFIETRTSYRPFLSDWIWTLILPPCAYLALLTAAAVLLRAQLTLALYAVAASSLLLLLLGLHKAWDVVAWITTERHTHGARQRSAPSKQD